MFKTLTRLMGHENNFLLALLYTLYGNLNLFKRSIVSRDHLSLPFGSRQDNP